MTTITLRPNATLFNDDTAVTGAASIHAATSDDSDSSYVTVGDGSGGGSLLVSLGTASLPAGAVTKQIRPRGRARSESGTASGFSITTGRVSDNYNNASVTEDLSATITDVAGAWAATTFSQSDIDGMGIEVTGSFSEDVRVMELYADVMYVALPVVAVTPVDPDPFAASTTVPIAWVNTLDADGGAPTRYRVYVTEYWDSDIVVFDTGDAVGSVLTVNAGPLTNGAYTVNVRVGQTVNGETLWSDYASDSFNVEVDTSDIDSVTMVAVPASARIDVTVNHDGTSPAWEFIEVQRSTDAGATWADVRGATYVDATGNASTFAISDHEVGNGQNVRYQARATWISTGLPITGAWRASSTDEVWSAPLLEFLKNVSDPSLNLVVQSQPEIAEAVLTVRHGVHHVLGARYPIGLSDVVTARSSAIRYLTTTPADLVALRALLRSAPTLLIVEPAKAMIGTGDSNDGLVHAFVTGIVESAADPLSYTDNVITTVSYQQVAAPADEDAER